LASDDVSELFLPFYFHPSSIVYFSLNPIMLQFYSAPFSVTRHTDPGVILFLRYFVRNCWISCLFLLFHFPAIAQSIQGRVTDATTGKALDNVNVSMTNTSLLTITDREGKFSLAFREKASTGGTYTLRASAVGYDSYEQRIEPGTDVVNDIRIALDPSVIQLNKALVVSPRRQESAQFDLPEAISVRTARQLDQDAPRTAPEALTGTTGVWLQKTNHGGGSPFLRGLTGQQTLLMIDGIRLNNASFRSGPNQYLNTIDPQTIDQIEALRGSGSVQYGSDALGGVVHVLTRDPRFSGNGLRLTGSAYAKVMSADMEKSARAELGLSSENVALTAGLSYRDYGDLLAGGNLGFQRPTGYQQWSGDVKGKIRMGGNQLLTLAYQGVQLNNVPLYHRVRLENFAYYQFDPQRRDLAYARWEWFGKEKWLRNVQVTALNQRWAEGRQSQRNGSATRTEERDDIHTWGATLVVHSQPGTHWSASSGIEYYHDQVGSRRNDVDTQNGQATARRGLYPDGSTYANLAAYSLHTLELNRWRLSAGARWNTFQITVKENVLGESTIRPAALVGNFSALYVLQPHHHLIASVHSAFRAPNVDDLGTLGIVDFRYEVPNANLKPEKSLNLEVGWKVKTERLAGSISLYRNFLSDIITRVRQGRDSVAGYPVYLKENTAKAYIQGLEAEAEYRVFRTWVAYANLTYTYGQNETGNEPFRRIPPLNGLLGIRYGHDRGFWACAEWLAAAKQTRLAAGDKDDNRIPKGGTPGWTVFNLYAGWGTPHWKVSVSAQNLFDIPYRTHGSGVDGMGRGFFLSGRISF